MNDHDLDILKQISTNPPHTITKRGGALSIMRVDPISGRSYFDPIYADALRRQGYDPTPVLQEMEATLRKSGDWRE